MAEIDHIDKLQPALACRDDPTLAALYSPLVQAAVETRKDIDQIAFRYLATLTTLVGILLSEAIDLGTPVARAGVTVVVVALLGVAVESVRRRARVYLALYETLVRIERAIGGFERGRYLKDEALFPWGDPQGDLGRRQHWPHLVGLLLLAASAVAAVWFV